MRTAELIKSAEYSEGNCVTPTLQNPSAHQQIAKLLSDYSCKKITGGQFADGVLDVRFRKDENLGLVVNWIVETFEPEFSKHQDACLGSQASATRFIPR